jgi:putative transposase
MKKRFTEEQIIKTLKRWEAGEKPKDLCRELSVHEQTLYNWKSKFGGMEVSEAKRLKELEQENLRLKKLVADLSLDNQILKEVNSKKW